jgi:DNA polymerase-3 subunit delta'
MIFPWHTNVWAQLWQAKFNDRLPHALLFSGIQGLGKVQFADRFSRALLCEMRATFSEQEIADKGHCGSCHACRLLANRTHPNVLWIGPEKEGQAIKIDQIRALSEFTQQSSWQGEHRIVLVHPAHAMNTNAVNALLKTLEEPSPFVLLILISDQPGALPPTVLSRCQRILFQRPDKREAQAWLKQELEANSKSNKKMKGEEEIIIDEDLLLCLANGAPLKALQLFKDGFFRKRHHLLQALYSLGLQKENPLKLAAHFEDIETMRLIDTILTWMLDIVWLQLAVNENQIVNRDFLKELTALKEQSEMRENMAFIIYLQKLRGQLCAGINLNKLLVIESMFIRYMKIPYEKMSIHPCF